MSNAETLLERRYRLLGAGAPLFYDEPVHIVRGEGVWLYDAQGKPYLDAYNNVPHVGHCHPHVVEALCRQAGQLNVHNRYLHTTILDYTERLSATLDDSLAMAIFTCTGSESNEVALRMARGHTGGQGIICSNFSYHGNTTAVWELATAFFEDGASPGDYVLSVPFPDPYRAGPGSADETVAAVEAAIEQFQKTGTGFAGLLLCPLFSSEGLPNVAPAYMQTIVNYVHAAGGLFIADEVQAGLGRCGETMWGHQLYGVVPDIVTLGKPMGNGHPVGGVIARTDLVNEFRAASMYFNTFAGNPVSCAVGMAVLDVLEQEKLMENALNVGEYLRDQLRARQARHDLIGDVRGRGLFTGVELVTERQAKTPASREAGRVVNAMRHNGVLISRIGPHDNVLKIRPPMPFSRGDADRLLSVLDDVLASL